MRQQRTLALLLALPLLISTIGLTEGQTNEWTLSAGGNNEDKITDFAVSKEGQTFAVGYFYDEILFGNLDFGIWYNSTYDNDAGFVIEIDSGGDWSGQGAMLDSQGEDFVHGIELLSNGSFVIFGQYCVMSENDTCSLAIGDTLTLTPTYPESNWGSMFLASGYFSPEGIEWYWAVDLATSSWPEQGELSVNDQDEILFSFLHSGSLVYGDEEYTTEGYNVISVGKDSDFLQIFSIQTSTLSFEFNTKCISKSGNVAILFSFINPIQVSETIEFTSYGGSDVGLVIFSSTGNLISAEQIGGVGYDWPNQCHFNENEELIISLQFTEEIEIEGGIFTSLGQSDALLMKFNQAGNLTAHIFLSGSGSVSIADIESISSGSTLLTGHFSGNLTYNDVIIDDFDRDEYLHNGFIGELDSNFEWSWISPIESTGEILSVQMELSMNEAPILGFVYTEFFEIQNFLNYSMGDFDFVLWQYASDLDYDGISDMIDNCHRIPNVNQTDYDEDGIGDHCDLDLDGDGILNEFDACGGNFTNLTSDKGWESNTITDNDADGCRDIGQEDDDDDNDGIIDVYDICPRASQGWISTPQNDADRDGCSDTDTDNDGFVDQMDNCPLEYNPGQADFDGDGLGDGCDDDDDGDGIADEDDRCPSDSFAWYSNQSTDHDNDGCNDTSLDNDDDNDGVLDLFDICPKGIINALSEDFDLDGCHDQLEDIDDDNDGIDDENDSCLQGLLDWISSSATDFDSDGCQDLTEDDDDDNDEVLDFDDVCAFTKIGEIVDTNGCSNWQKDDDGDGVNNADDLCPSTISGLRVTENGCPDLILLDETSNEASEGNNLLAMTLFSLSILVIIIALIIYVRNTKSQP